MRTMFLLSLMAMSKHRLLKPVHSLIGQRLHLLQCHLFVGFVVEIEGLAAARLVADHALKDKRGAIFSALEARNSSLRCNGLADDQSVAPARRFWRAPAHWRQHGNLVVRPQWRIGPGILLIHRQGKRR